MVVEHEAGSVPTIAIDLISAEFLNTEAGCAYAGASVPCLLEASCNSVEFRFLQIMTYRHATTPNS